MNAMERTTSARSLPVRHGTLAVLMSLFSAVLLGTFLTNPTYAQATGVVYVESNIPAPNGNSILAYSRDEAGNLTPLPGSPFATGGAGVGSAQPAAGQFDSDQNVIINPEGTLLFAVNSGSNDIAVFHIRPDGTLVPVDGSPFPSGGVNPVSVGLAGDKLYVVHKSVDSPGDVLPNYTGFQVTPDGQLTPIPDSTIEVPAGSSPTQALISADNGLLFGADFLSGVLQAFRILGDGRLLQSPNTPLPLPDASNPLGLQVHPTQPLLYVGFVSNNELGIYSYDDMGALTFLRTVTNSGVAICWFAVNRAGSCLYSANTGDGSVSAYDLTDPTTPVEIQTVPLRGNAPLLPFQLALDPTEAFLHVVDQGGNALHVLQVNAPGCTLTEVPSSPLALDVPGDTRPEGVAAR